MTVKFPKKIYIVYRVKIKIQALFGAPLSRVFIKSLDPLTFLFDWNYQL